MKAVHTKILKVSLSLITEQEFLRNSNEFCVVESKRILVEVSDKKYDECLAEIENYKRQDQLMNWTSRNPDYYNISGWNFDVKPDEIIRIID